MFLGNNGFNIVSFEPSKRNYYILLKNYCLNQDINMRIINKGLDVEDKKCTYKTSSGNQGNGWVLCENRDRFRSDLDGETVNNVELTKLSKYYNYLSKKNLAFIKMDVEGSEANVLEGGKELITKYHVPFVVLEFTPNYLKELDSDPEKLIQFFINNGYKISINGFLSKN